MDEQRTGEDRVEPRAVDGGWSSITFAVDAGRPHDEALRWVAERSAGGIEHVHVLGLDAPVAESRRSGGTDDEAITTAVRTACPGVRVSVARRPGPVAEALLDSAEDVVVIGAYRRRRGGTAGRVPARVAERSAVPIVVVPEGPHRIDGDVVLAVDEPLDEHALRIAVDEAVRRSRRLTLLRAWEMPVLTRTGLTDFAEDPLRWRRVNAELLARATGVVTARFPDLRVHPLLVEGHPGRAIADHTRSASLVVLGQGHVHVLGGSVLHDLLHATHSPVCVVPRTVVDVDRPVAEIA